MMVSIVIVHYRAKKELYECLDSIYSSKIKIPFQVIVVDNDEGKNIEKELSKRFKRVLYIRSLNNIGFGAGNNLGVRYSKGEYLFFLNPDTKLYRDCVDTLVKFLLKNKDAAIVAPLLLDKNKKTYPLQGTRELTLKSGLFALTFLNKLFPNNPVSKKYWLKDWDKKEPMEVAVVPGTAFMIRKRVFEKVGGFDERFFLYFEESDLCRRVKMAGYKIFMHPQPKVIHIWGASTRWRKDIKSIFSKSRFLYFKKHFGILPALIIHALTSIKLGMLQLNCGNKAICHHFNKKRRGKHS